MITHNKFNEAYKSLKAYVIMVFILNMNKPTSYLYIHTHIMTMVKITSMQFSQYIISLKVPKRFALPKKATCPTLHNKPAITSNVEARVAKPMVAPLPAIRAKIKFTFDQFPLSRIVLIGPEKVRLTKEGDLSYLIQRAGDNKQRGRKGGN